MSTGLVTTTNVTSATPAGFGAHTTTRSDTSGIAYDYLNQTRPNVLFGGGGYSMSSASAQAAGYKVITDRAAMLALNTEQYSRVSGQFGGGTFPYEYDGLGSQPHLSEMAAAAFSILDNDPDGFFVMVEGGLIDRAASANDTPRMIGEMVEFNRTVQAAISYASTHPGTLILVTADHETGGLTIMKNNGAGKYPTVKWTTVDHTGANVGLWITGLVVSSPSTPLDNTQIPGLITGDRFP
jgi:alkaline phosphatase